jgi:hypothetical protein
MIILKSTVFLSEMISLQHRISLEDCSIWSEPVGSLGYRRIHFALPVVLALYGIKEEINNCQIGHERFENPAGTLFVACDYTVGYWPTENIRAGTFVSEHGWPQFKGRVFTLFNLNLEVAATDTPEQLRSSLRSHPDISAFLESFWTWLDIETKQHPDCLTPVPANDYYRNCFGR